QLDLRLREVEVRGVNELARLPAQGRDDVRVRVAEQIDGDAGDQIEVLAAGLVVDQASSTADERDRQPAPGLHEVPVGELRRRMRDLRHGVTIVPMPASVNSSSRSACFVRPSTMCASGTPSSARRHASSLGIMPPVTSPLAMRLRASSLDSTGTTSPSAP